MDQNNLSLDLLLQETFALSELLGETSKVTKKEEPELKVVDAIEFSDSTEITIEETDYLLDLADGILHESKTQRITDLDTQTLLNETLNLSFLHTKEIVNYPESSGVIYKVDNGMSTFCVRGFTTSNIAKAFKDLNSISSQKRSTLKLSAEDSLEDVFFFKTKSVELAEAIKEQIINRRFPHQEDAVCNISDPGFSWWMNPGEKKSDGSYSGKFEIFFKAHSINRMEEYVQLGPIGDGAIAALRMNQARTLLRSSFPISEYSCDEKSFQVASQKPDHLSFLSFKNIFLLGENNTELENFPDNSVGRALYYYFHELAIVRKFWIEVKTKLG